MSLGSAGMGGARGPGRSAPLLEPHGPAGSLLPLARRTLACEGRVPPSARPSAGQGRPPRLQSRSPTPDTPGARRLDPRPAAALRHLDPNRECPPATFPSARQPWYAPGDRCLGVFSMWGAADAQVKCSTSGGGGGRGARSRTPPACRFPGGRAGQGGRLRSSERQVRGPRAGFWGAWGC